MIRSERSEDIAILTMEHGKANALDVEFLEAIAEAVTAVADSDARAVVVTGSGHIFSAGVDLFRILDGGSAYIDRFLPALDRAFRALFSLERPVVAAINGHAIAGGCVLAQACDDRVMAAGPGRIGIPELLVGVPFPSLALEIVRNAVPAHTFRAAVYFGATHDPESALAAGLVDVLVPPDGLMSSAVDRAGHLAGIPGDAYALTKRAVVGPALERSARNAAAIDAHVVEVWKRESTRDGIAAYVERTVRQKKK